MTRDGRAPTLLVATEAPPARGGMQRWLLDLARAYAESRPVIVVGPAGADAGALAAAGVTAFEAVDGLRDRIASEPGAIAREIVEIAGRHGADRAHLAQAGLGFLAGPLEGVGVETLLTVHGSDLLRPWLGPRTGPAARFAWVREHLPGPARVQAVSRFSADRSLEAGSRGPVAVIPPAIDAARWTPGHRAEARRRLGLPADSPVLLSVGRIVPRKGHADICDALELLPREVHWLLAGEPARHEIDAADLSDRIADRAHRYPSADDALLLDLHHAADLFVLAPFLHVDALGWSLEGFGIVFLEAAACGLPVVATRSGGVPDAVADGETGLLVPPRDAAALARAIESLLGDPDRRERMGAAGRARVLAHFTHAHLAERLLRDEAAHAAGPAESRAASGSREPAPRRLPGESRALAEALLACGWIDRLPRYEPVTARIVRPRFRARPPALSAIVISHRAGPEVAACLSVLARSDDAELVYVANGPAGQLPDPLLDALDVQVELRWNTGAYLARNLGAVFARAPILVFVEDDGLPAPDLLAAHRDAHARWDVVSVRGVYRPHRPERAWNRGLRHYDLGPTPFPVFADVEGNTSYARGPFLAAGGWDDEIFFGGGGVDLALRLLEVEPDPCRQIYTPAAVLHHDFARDEAHLARKTRLQERSRERLRRVRPGYDRVFDLWRPYRGRADRLRPRSPGT